MNLASPALADEKLPLLTAGTDEAGRGPLAGPVVAAAVILGKQFDTTGLRDSKKLSQKQREKWHQLIITEAYAYSICVTDAREIDRINILQASLEAMRKAIEQIMPQPRLVLVDGNQVPNLSMPMRAIVGGDDLYPAISAASVVAKVTRDQIMLKLHEEYPQYGFDKHKGYPTPQHLAALREHGPCPAHRRSFGPVKQLSLL